MTSGLLAPATRTPGDDSQVLCATPCSPGERTVLRLGMHEVLTKLHRDGEETMQTLSGT